MVCGELTTLRVNTFSQVCAYGTACIVEKIENPATAPATA
jgi:hypothetical protein